VGAEFPRLALLYIVELASLLVPMVETRHDSNADSLLGSQAKGVDHREIGLAAVFGADSSGVG